jgi:glycosyltransferase involved in cell wall biosynthesis
MIERLLHGRFARVRLHHVRMAFSREIAEIGQGSPRKLAHLAKVISQIAYIRAKSRAQVLYYPPAAPNRSALYRDMIVLSAARRWFQKTIYHFHAGGLSDTVESLTAVERRLFHRVFDRPDGAILLSELNPPDGAYVGARKQFVIPYGIEDVAPSYMPERRNAEAPVILYVGILVESKGVMILLESCVALKARGLGFRLRLMGGFTSKEFENRVRAFVARHDLRDQVDLLGVLTGEDKWKVFAAADILCFPTFYEMETFGVVVLEAMQFSLPVVASTWRALPSIVDNGRTGLLVQPRDAESCTNALAVLLSDADLRNRMGRAARERFLAEFTAERWYERMESALVALAEP